MGTRLYPLTTNKRLIETIAGVPEGTVVELENLEAVREDLGSDAWYELMDEYPHAMRLYDFQLFGFGKLNNEQWAIAKSVCEPDEEYSGTTRDKTLVREMLNNVRPEWKARLGLINLEDLDGVYWS